ncbi:hypothetical protein, partial [Enterobacter hormaechei]
PDPLPGGVGGPRCLFPWERVTVMENFLILRLNPLYHPPLELLLVGFYPPIHLAIDIILG